MIQTLPATAGVEKAVVIQLEALRKQRNAIDYSGDLISNSMVDEAIAHAAALYASVKAVLGD